LEETDKPIYWAHGIPTWKESLGTLVAPVDFSGFEVYRKVPAADGGLDRVILRKARLLRGVGGESRVVDEYEIDLTRQSAVLSQVTYRDDKAVYDTRIEHQRTPSGWLPQTWTLLAYDAENLLMTHECQVVELTIDPPLDDTQFTFDPPAASVMVYGDGTHVRVGEDGSLHPFEPFAVSREGPQGGFRPAWLVVLAAVLVLTIATAIVVRSRRKQA
jgi:hypothetical protein